MLFWRTELNVPMDDAGATTEPKRVPRFEARTAYKSRKAVEKEKGIGLSSVQGAISGLKDYAAIHAIKEGASTPLNELFSF